MYTYVPDNLWGEMLPSIDNTQLNKDCLWAEKFLIDSLPLIEDVGIYGNITTASHNRYNLLTFPVESFQTLYHSIASVVKPCLPKETHVIQCWLNVFRCNEFVDWHSHWHPSQRVVHGFYCVNVTPSFTEYKFEHLSGEIFKVDSTEGLLVFGKSNSDQHRSSPWTNNLEPRITIAFDLIPITTLLGDQIHPNHFLPF